MKTSDAPVIYLKDYLKPLFVFESTELDIQLDFTATQIVATHRICRNAENNPEDSSRDNSKDNKALTLDCERMAIHSIKLNGIVLNSDQFQVTETELTIHQVPDRFELTIHNSIDPSSNTALSGLYQSADMLCTQCEAEGYRRITPALDRPDSLTIYTVKLSANKSDFPILLSNGNLIDQLDIDDHTHCTTWHDPFPKPTYLFAIVAGKLESLKDTFKTQSGRTVDLCFYTRGKDIDKCHHAMASLKRSMIWDEQLYGREYDLDLFNVVAVEDFNMGAMENKSLNVFNTKYVLADSKMATDTDFDNVESVIGHEYFHNWSGNRVTCRDWFQLSLKEGFTVFRDQEFSADMGSRGVKRISDVNVLRSHQFKEDASPMAHPVRPDSYQEINNFYTVTIYNKGAEVVRMIHTILGKNNFRKGTDLYFDRHDGEAVTTDDFVAAMEDANGVDFSQFKHWYNQAGTPEVSVSSQYDNENNRLVLNTKQSCPDTPGQTNKHPFVIPVKVALFGANGSRLLIENQSTESVLLIDQRCQSFHLENISEKPVVSYLREFSAPIKLTTDQSDSDWFFLLEHDDDPFSKWEAGHSLLSQEILRGYQLLNNGETYEPNPEFGRVFKSLLSNEIPDPAFLAQVLTLPGLSYLGELVSPIDPAQLHQARQTLQRSLANACEEQLNRCLTIYEQLNTGIAEPEQMAARSLRDACLHLISILDDISRNISERLFHQPKCMTDESIAISVIANSDRNDKTQLLDGFYQRWQNEPLVIDKWLRAQSTAPLSTTLKNVEALTTHPGFDYKNPNKVYSLILGFTHGNPVCFHAENGEGYRFLKQWVEKLDPVNPQVTARLVSALSGWNKFKPLLRDQMHRCLQEIDSIPSLSRDVSEIVSKNLKSN